MSTAGQNSSANCPVGSRRQCVPCRSQGLTLRQVICTGAVLYPTQENLHIFAMDSLASLLAETSFVGLKRRCMMTPMLFSLIAIAYDQTMSLFSQSLPILIIKRNLELKHSKSLRRQREPFEGPRFVSRSGPIPVSIGSPLASFPSVERLLPHYSDPC